MKDRFLEISGIRKEIHNLFLRLEEKRKGMKENYVAFVSSNHNNFFAIDSLRFQLKLTENELTFLNEQFILIDNRLYCDYYKLYNYVYDYYVANISTELVKSVFPIYKDLDPTKVYEHEMVHKVYKDVSFIIHKAYEFMELEHRKRDNEKRLISTGIHIGNYVHTRVFTDTIIKTNIQMFEQYLNTYFIYHMTFLVNLKDRLGMLLHNVMRKPPPEQGCNVDEIEDNFIRVMKDTNEHMLDEISCSKTEQNNESNTKLDVSDVSYVSVYTQTDDLNPEPEAEPETKTDDVDEPEAEVASEPVVEPVVQPEADVASEVASEPVVEPEADVASEVASEPVVEPVVQPEAEVASEVESEPVVEPVVKPEADVASEPVVEPVVKPEADVASEVASEPVVEPESDVASEPVVQPVAQPVVQPEPIVEVFNPIIDHILENKIAEPKKKKRARKIKQGI